MKRWYSSITLPKYDISQYGHWSGTGLVVFDEKKFNIILE